MAQILITFSDEHPVKARDAVERAVFAATENLGWVYGRSIDVEVHEQDVYGTAVPKCDICGDTDPEGEDWNGETGSHLTCEQLRDGTATLPRPLMGAADKGTEITTSGLIHEAYDAADGATMGGDYDGTWMSLTIGDRRFTLGFGTDPEDLDGRIWTWSVEKAYWMAEDLASMRDVQWDMTDNNGCPAEDVEQVRAAIAAFVNSR